jgi:hypothetical protein
MFLCFVTSSLLACKIEKKFGRMDRLNVFLLFVAVPSLILLNVPQWTAAC